jgi:hypothetical protein
MAYPMALKPVSFTVLEKAYASETPPTWKLESWSLRDVVGAVKDGSLNPDPISQRDDTDPDGTKSIDIIKALIFDHTFGASLILRDISNDPVAQAIYGKNVKYLVIDGGHRTRSLVAFHDGKLLINGMMYTDMDFDLAEKPIPVTIYECTSQQAMRIFRSVNLSTLSNSMENIMSDEQSLPLQYIRKIVKYYKEYDNESLIHPLFENTISPKEKKAGKYISGNPNPRAKWFEYVAIAMIKAAGKGHVSAGYNEISKLAEEEEVTNNVKEVVKRFLNDAKKVVEARSKNSKWSQTSFGAFQIVWFGLYEENQKFKIKDYDKFTQTFIKVYSGLTDKTKQTPITINSQHHILTTWWKSNVTAFGTESTQKKCYKLFRKNSITKNITIDDLGVVFRENKRSKSRDDREKNLALQDNLCAIDGLYLSLDDSVWGHDNSWSEGGELEAGAVIRRCHNEHMGKLTLAEYKNTCLNT